MSESEKVAAELFDQWFGQGSKYPTTPGTIIDRFIALVAPAIAAARAEGIREGMEQAAKVIAAKAADLHALKSYRASKMFFDLVSLLCADAGRIERDG